MNLQEIKDELKEMYPKMQGFIQHTLVAEMCLKWHEKQVKNCSIPDVVGRSEQLVCDNHYPDLEHFINYSESICKTCKQKI